MKMRKPPSHRRSESEGPLAKVRRATRMIVAINRQQGEDDEEIRSIVLKAIKEALAGSGEWKMVDQVDMGGGDVQPQELVTMAGVYRQVLDLYRLDRSDQRLQESWYATAETALAEALRETDGDFRRGERRPDA